MALQMHVPDKPPRRARPDVPRPPLFFVEARKREGCSSGFFGLGAFLRSLCTSTRHHCAIGLQGIGLHTHECTHSHSIQRRECRWVWVKVKVYFLSNEKRAPRQKARAWQGPGHPWNSWHCAQALHNEFLKPSKKHYAVRTCMKKKLNRIHYLSYERYKAK